MKKYQDHYYKQAKKQNYPARSVYKLKEMDKRFHLFKPGLRVLDLGAAPGSWTMFAAEKVGAKGTVVAIDLQDLTIHPLSNVTFFQEDVYELSQDTKDFLYSTGPFGMVISDMAPKTTGIKFTDQARSYDLAMQSLAFAGRWLVQGGTYIVKIFQGPDIPELQASLRSCFKTVKSFKPKSSRAESKEMFFIGLKKNEHAEMYSNNMR